MSRSWLADDMLKKKLSVWAAEFLNYEVYVYCFMLSGVLYLLYVLFKHSVAKISDLLCFFFRTLVLSVYDDTF